MMRKPEEYKLQYFSNTRNKWVDSCSTVRGSLGKVSKEAKIVSKLPDTMKYRAVPVKVEPVVAKKKEKATKKR